MTALTARPRSHAALASLLTLALATGVWKVATTESVTEDTVLFVRFARQLGGEEPPWNYRALHEHRHPIARAVLDELCRRVPAAGVMETYAQHPGFALSMLWTHRLIGKYLACEEPWQWVRAGQLVCLLVTPLLLVSAWVLGRRLLGLHAGLAGLVCLVASPGLLAFRADALSDVPTLAFFLTSTLFGVDFLHRHRGRDAGLCGVFGGIGYWFRPEAALTTCVLIAWVVFRIAWVVFRRGGENRRDGIKHLAALSVPLALFCGPYMLLCGKVLTKSAGEIVAVQAGPGVDPTVAHEHDASHSGSPGPARVLSRGFRRLIEGWDVDLGRGVLPLVLVGLWAGRRSLVTDPGQRLVAILLLIYVVLLPCGLYYRKGYLDPRHTLSAALLSVPWVWPGLRAAAGWLSAWPGRLAGRLTGGAAVGARGTDWLCGAAVVALAALSLIRSGTPLHVERAGQRQTGEWLRGHVGPGRSVLDPGRIAAFFAGLDARNLWPHCYPSLSRATVEDQVSHTPRADWLILCDRLVPAGAVSDWNDEFASVRLVEQVCFPVSADQDCRSLVRVYRVDRGDRR